MCVFPFVDYWWQLHFFGLVAHPLLPLEAVDLHLQVLLLLPLLEPLTDFTGSLIFLALVIEG